jgi:hypothetical protein
MNAFDRLQQWEAGAGAGKDAAGRTVYTGPGMMYKGPREHSATQAEHEKMKIAAAKADPEAMLIRELLEQLKNPRPGVASVHGLIGSYNAPDMRINMQDPRQDPRQAQG